MTVRWRVLVSALLLAWGSASSADKGADFRARVTEERSREAVRVDAVLPGELVSYALPRDANGRREIVLMIRPHVADASASEKDRSSAGKPDGDDEADDYRKIPPCPSDGDGETADAAEEGPLALYRLDVDRKRLDLLREDLPSDGTALEAADLDGDGAQELIVARPGELLRVERDPGRPPLSLLERPGIEWESLHPSAIRQGPRGGRPWASTTELGRLSLFGPQAGETRWTVMAEVDLPLEADVGPDGISLWSGSPVPVGHATDGKLFFASAPEAFGKTRVQTTLVEVAPDGSSSTTDCWGRLPEPEDLLGSSFLFVDDRPVLVVETKRGDKLNLFGEKRLRLYPLERDRSRLGLLPLFEVETRINLWQEATPRMLDVNGDGREDLVVGYWKGILKDRVVIDAYLRTADGGFDPSVRNTALDVPKGDRDFVQYGEDLTGDARADLLVRGKKGLMIYPGRPSKNGKRLVQDRPVVIRVSEREKASKDEAFFTFYTGARPRVVDLDGDGRYDILLVYTGSGSAPGLIRLVRPTL